MPTMTAPEKEHDNSPHTGTSLPDDIVDPPVPEALKTSLAATAGPPGDVTQPVYELAHLDDRVMLTVDKAMWKITEHVLTGMKAVDKSISGGLEALAANHSGMRTLAEALTSYAPIIPFAGTVRAVSPTGFPVTLSAQGRTQEEFLERLGSLLKFLKAQGFQPQPDLV